MRDSIALNIYVLTFGEVAGYGKTIHNGFVRNALQLSSAKPPMSTFQLHLNNLSGAVSDWGIEGNRGSHADYTHVLTSSTQVITDIKMLADYIQNEQADNAKLWIDVGFSLRKAREKNQSLEMVQNFRHFISRGVPPPSIKLRWEKPLDTKTNLVRGYIIQTNTIPEYPKEAKSKLLMNVLDIVTETAFIHEKPLHGENWYWVTPFNTAGIGVTSNPIMVYNPMRMTMESEG
jgi:hypothetical protein